MGGVADQIADETIRVLSQDTPLWLLKAVIRQEQIGFFYHVVSDETLPHIRHLYPYKSPVQFEEDIRYLKQHYDVLPVEKLSGFVGHSTRFRRQGFFLSFDDGHRECFDCVLPILRKHEIRGVFFITTGCVDNERMCCSHKVSLCIDRIQKMESVERRQTLDAVGKTCKRRVSDESDFEAWIKSLSFTNEEILDTICVVCGVDVAAFLEERKPYMTKEQIRTLAREGHVIGAHTVRHPYLGRLTDVNRIEAEVVDSCKFVAELTQTDRVPFAFPFSGRSLDSKVLESILERHPIVGDVFDSRGVHRDKPFVRNRICADQPSPREGVSNIPLLTEEAYRDELRQISLRANTFVRVRGRFFKNMWLNI